MIRINLLAVERKAAKKKIAIFHSGQRVMAGCVLLFFSLGWYTIKLFLIWAVVGLVIYFAYARRKSHLAPGNEHLLHAHSDDPKLAPNPMLQEGPDAGP